MSGEFVTGKRQAAPGEGAVLEVMQWGGLLLYATQRGGIHAWDLRADTLAWTLPCTSNQARPRLIPLRSPSSMRPSPTCLYPKCVGRGMPACPLLARILRGQLKTVGAA